MTSVIFARWVDRAGERSWATLVREAFKDLRELVTATG
jgi:hypothetical protein